MSAAREKSQIFLVGASVLVKDGDLFQCFCVDDRATIAHSHHGAFGTRHAWSLYNCNTHHFGVNTSLTELKMQFWRSSFMSFTCLGYLFSAFSCLNDLNLICTLQDGCSSVKTIGLIIFQGFPRQHPDALPAHCRVRRVCALKVTPSFGMGSICSE